jgi:hypothetical protein
MTLFDILWEAFNLGCDYGMVAMENERINEDNFNGFLGSIYDQKCCAPYKRTQQRQIHSKDWFDAKENSIQKLNKMIIELSTMDVVILCNKENKY